MTDKTTESRVDSSDMRSQPESRATVNEPMTGVQRSYLKRLSEEANEPFDGSLTKAEASERIEAMHQQTWRGVGEGGTSPA
jgi:hypothetical protein